MNIDLPGGRYVIAVSGGVDSMALLEILKGRADLELIVAHFDHGIRPDSHEDRRLIQDVAKQNNLRFIYDEGKLGPDASEAQARKARYDFLHKVRKVSKSQGVITAHHKDDLLETAILNILRGTGRRGLTSLRSRDNIYRPLLHVSKNDILKFAQENNVVWREDSTNQDVKYLRNYIRNVIVPKISAKQKQELLHIIHTTHGINEEIELALTSLLHSQPALNKLDRHWFIMLPNSVANEVMNRWLKKHKVKDIDKKLIHKLVIAAKASADNRVADVDKNYMVRFGAKDISLVLRNR